MTKRKTNSLPNSLWNIIYIALAIFSSFALTVKIDAQSVLEFARKDTNVLLGSILALGLYFFYKKFIQQNKKRIPFIILSIVFTLLLIYGYSFDVSDGTNLVYGKYFGVTLIKLIGFFPLIYTLMNVVYDKLDSLEIKEGKKNKITLLFDHHPFLFTCVVLLIAFIPYIIAYYPAVMGYDPANQIKEVMGIHNRYMDSVVLIDPNVTITNFNPVLHTLLLGNCFKIGVNIGNVNFGLFIYSIIQVTFMICVLAYSISFLKREGVPNKLLFIIIAIYSLVPIFPFYSLSTNKDTFFTLFFMLYIIKMYEFIKYEPNKKRIISFILVAVLLCLSRNNGIYTVLLSLPFCLVIKNKRLTTVVCLAAILACNMCYTKVILPAFKITPTSIRETLSVPFQQTAALIKNSESIISEEDKETISKILDYDTIKTSYNPELADRVKNTFNPNYKDEDLKAYFNVWFKYLCKKPLVYIDATINNVYGYFYPNTSKWYLYYTYNTKLKEAGFDYHYNDLKITRTVLEGYGEAFPYIPLLGLFVNIGFNVWVYLYLVCALIVKKNKKQILILLPALSLILVCIASPANTYFRYAMPYIMTLPLVAALLYKNKDHQIS